MTEPPERISGVAGAAYALRLLLELAGLVAVAWWGIQTGSDSLSRAVLAIGAAALLAVSWGLVVAPRARNDLKPRTRWIVGSVLLLVAAGMLWVVGPAVLAVIFAVLIVIDTIVVLRLDRDPASRA